jgi:tetratricopeptide (TPR) repeat protein
MKLKLLFAVASLLLWSILCLVGSNELFADDSEYKNLLEFDEMLHGVEDSIRNRTSGLSSDKAGTSSLTLDYANLAMMYHQRNERWKQGGSAESLQFINLALQAQDNAKDIAHPDRKLLRSMMLHKGLMLTSLGKRAAALDVFNQIIAEHATSMGTQSKRNRINFFGGKKTNSAMSNQEFAKVLLHKAELLYTLYDDYASAVELFRRALDLYPCHYLVHQHLIQAMKGSKQTTQEDWRAVLSSMETYLLRVKQRPALSTDPQHRFKYKAPAIDYRIANPAYQTDRVSRIYGIILNPLHWVRVFSAACHDWYDYLFVSKDKVVCTFSNGGVDSQNDLYANLGSVRTIESFHAIQASLYWSMFVAADAMAPSVTTSNEGGTVRRTTTLSNHTTNATSVAWLYLQQARHFERLRLNEQLERVQYEQAQERERALDDVQDPLLAAELAAQTLIGNAGLDNSPSGLDRSVGRVLQTVEEKLDEKELHRHAAQTAHVAKFFEKGYWGGTEEYYDEFTSGSGGSDSGPVEDDSVGTRTPAKKGDRKGPTKGDSADTRTRAKNRDRQENGTLSRVPIFVVGFFRSGSTLLEELLVKHAAVPVIADAGARSVGRKRAKSHTVAGATETESAANELGFQRTAVWGMGEDSPFVFEMYAMQEETLAAYAYLDEQKKQLNATAAQGKAKVSKKARQQQENDLEAEFMRHYKEIINRRAQIIVDKMGTRFREVHTDYSVNATAPSGSRSADSSCVNTPPTPLHIVDKMLTNYLNIGLIHLVFPRAIILHTVRDPLDTLFSCYANRFGDPSASYTLHLTSLVQRYAHYLQVMQHFREVLPFYTLPRWRDDAAVDAKGSTSRGASGGAKTKPLKIQALIDVRYEELVASPERMLRHLIEEVLGLDYVPEGANARPASGTRALSRGGSEAALAGSGKASVEVGADGQITPAAADSGLSATDEAAVPSAPSAEAAATQGEETQAETVRVVRTASRLQIKSPVYWDSVGRWRKYAAQLNETLVPALRGQLPHLAELGALPFLDPDSALAKQAVNAAGYKTRSKAKSSPVQCSKKAGRCAYGNWDLREDFDYRGLLEKLV